MSQRNLKMKGPVPEEQGPGDPGSVAPTGEVPDLVVLEPELPAESDTAIVEAQAEGGGDDVYVILPEGEAGDIPVVETQVLVDTAAETTPLNDDPSVSKVAVLDSNPALDDTQSTGEEAGEEQETQTLDDLATEIDEDVLASEGASADQGDTSIAGVAVGGAGSLAGHDSDGRHSLGPVGEAPFAKKRSLFKVALPIAAAVLLSAGGYFYFLGGTPEGAGAHAGGEGAVASGGTTPGQQGGTGAGGSAPGPEGGTVAVFRPGDSLLAAKNVFREKILLALELGFGGEAKHE